MPEAGHRKAGLDESGLEQLLASLTAVRDGDFSKRLPRTGDPLMNQIATVFNGMADQLDLFTSEVTRVAREVGTEGKLGGQAEIRGVSGTWKSLTENVNELAQNLTRQVRAIAEVTSAVAAGDLTRSISVEAKGEVADLKDNVNAMVQSLRETMRANEEQSWLKANLARITGMMQGHRDLSVVADLIMEELAPLVGAQHGTFFLADDSRGETRLRLVAGYGLRADKDAPIQYRIGQSLIGQVAKSKRPIVVDDIPPGYIKISSGLGEAPPANLVVLPIAFEGQVIGVVELASFAKFTPVQVSFLEELTESLGVNVNAIVANSRTDSLLQESQRLTAELQARSEELQARSEELQASNADLEAQAALLAAQKEDIEAKNTEIELARQEIEERARQFALASQYKSQFLANMSHELRTPLNSLLILARLLAQNPSGNLSPKQVEYASVIHSAGSDLLNLINDILDLSKVEAGRMDVRTEAFLLSTLVEDIRATFQPLTAEKGLDFAVHIEPDVPRELVTDQQRLRQVLGNLLSNAVKFTDQGGITLRISLAAGRVFPQGAAVLAFAVTDTGIGIAAENLAGIFGAFQQGDGTLSRRYGGTGLGLSIARDVGALLGGEITVSSEPGRGSTFTLYLPATLPTALSLALSFSNQPTPVTGAPSPRQEARHEASRQAGPGDAATARTLLVVEGAGGGLLTLLAHGSVSDLPDGDPPVRISTAVTADQAITALTQAPVQCVVLDLTVPFALDFLDQVAEKAELRGVPVVAHARGGDDHPDAGELQRLRGGLDRLALVPSLDEVREHISLYLSAAGEPGRPAMIAGTEPPAALAPLAAASPADRGVPPARHHELVRDRKVLVIDDDPRNVFAITSTLKLHGMNVTEASSGQEGINALLAAPDTDVVLMDIMMPGMDGYAAMTIIRQMPEFARLPIIAVTARAMQGDRDKSLAAGATDYVTKPVEPEELLSCIERWLIASR